MRDQRRGQSTTKPRLWTSRANTHTHIIPYRSTYPPHSHTDIHISHQCRTGCWKEVCARVLLRSAFWLPYATGCSRRYITSWPGKREAARRKFACSCCCRSFEMLTHGCHLICPAPAPPPPLLLLLCHAYCSPRTTMRFSCRLQKGDSRVRSHCCSVV